MEDLIILEWKIYRIAEFHKTDLDIWGHSVEEKDLSSVYDADRESQPEGEWIMQETRFAEFPALSVDPTFGISWSASVYADQCLIIFLIYNI